MVIIIYYLTTATTSTMNLLLLLNFHRAAFFLIIKTPSRWNRWVCIRNARWTHQVLHGVLWRTHNHLHGRRVGRCSRNCTICSFINARLIIVTVVIGRTRRVVVLSTWIRCRIRHIVRRQLATLTRLLRIRV